MKNAVKINPEHPVLIDRYLTGKEIEVDAICDGEDCRYSRNYGAY